MRFELSEIDRHCCKGDESSEHEDIDLKFYGDHGRSLGQADRISSETHVPPSFDCQQRLLQVHDTFACVHGVIFTDREYYFEEMPVE